MKYPIIAFLSALILLFGINITFNQNYTFASAGIQQEEELQEETKKETKQEEIQEELPDEPQKAEPKPVEEIDTEPQEVMEDAPPAESERMKYFREKYEDSYEGKNFEEVWAGVIKSLEDKFCQVLKKQYTQTEQGFYKGTIISDYCIFALGADTTWDNLKLYSIKVPVIRGGVWITGRFQYKFIINEKDDGSVALTVKGEVSGFEEYVTYQVHFWDSNGYLEVMMLKKIRENLKLPPKEF